MDHFSLPTGRQYWQPPAPVMTAAGGPEGFIGPALMQGPAPLYYPGGRNLNLSGGLRGLLGSVGLARLGNVSGLADVNLLQLSGAVGGGVIGSFLAAMLADALPRKYKKWGIVAGTGLVPAMAIAGWFFFKEGFTYEFAEEEV